MRPVIKKTRRDPRYFLHENLEENVRLNVTGEETEEESGVEEHEKSDDDDDDRDRDSNTPGKQKLLKGEKSLYEKIRGAIEEVFNEYLEEK